MQEARLVSDDIPYGAVVSSFVKLGAGLPGNRIVHSSSIKPSISEFAALKENKQIAFPSSAAVPDAYFFRLSMAKLHFFKTRKGKGCK
ncbi:hypothetical protein OIU74_018012 [Salix koriyanagi]|uniref:Uncharacterized protein n=1 Tax=Salix koriyanagi TaxID=2511006 RepID=A0A9Q0WTZ6_9ROSI|nr:hypothetical protein OIU74_018012 [Salix koriyanagi]